MVQLKVGDTIPSATIFVGMPPEAKTTEEIFGQGRTILFAVPGAFTPGCSKTHLPGYVRDAPQLKEKLAADRIVCLAKNDPFVMHAWGQAHSAIDVITMASDPQGELMQKLDLGRDVPMLGGAVYVRFSAVVKDGVVERLHVEPDGKGLSCSLSNELLKTSKA